MTPIKLDLQVNWTDRLTRTSKLAGTLEYNSRVPANLDIEVNRLLLLSWTL